jgi:hypothetical protein
MLRSYNSRIEIRFGSNQVSPYCTFSKSRRIPATADSRMTQTRTQEILDFIHRCTLQSARLSLPDLAKCGPKTIDELKHVLIHVWDSIPQKRIT